MAPSTTHQDAPANEDAKVFQKAELPRGLGRYVLLKLLARGGMGEVYLASTTGLEGAEKAVVVKVIRREHVSDPELLRALPRRGAGAGAALGDGRRADRGRGDG
jgi:hypothetical protein